MPHIFRTINTRRDVENAVIQLNQAVEPLASLAARKPELFEGAMVHDSRLGMDIEIDNAIRQVEMVLINIRCALHNQKARKHGVLNDAEA